MPPDLIRMTSPQFNPRRRFINKDTPPFPSYPPPSQRDAATEQSCTNLPLRKSSTFHTPTTPPSQDDDPIVNIPLLPRRSPTCAKSLEDAVTAGEKRIQHLMDVVDRSLSGLEEFSSDSQETLRAEDLPVPRFMLDAHVGDPDSMDVDRASNAPSPRPFMQRPTHKHHTSDSGIGSTTTGSEDSLLKMKKGMVQSHLVCTKTYCTSANKPLAHNNLASMPTCEIQSGINGSAAGGAHAEFGSQHALSEYACRHIQKHLISPIITESSLKDFHPLVRGIPYRVGRKEITCLRDLEKVLLWLAPVSGSRSHHGRSSAHFLLFGVQKWSVSKKSFLNFCETTIQCLHTTVGFLNEQDQRRPNDRPYTNGYFLDLTEQVRQYAAMINASRARLAAGKRMTDKDCTSYVFFPCASLLEADP